MINIKMVSGEFCGSTEEGVNNSVLGFGCFHSEDVIKIGLKR